MMKKCAVCGETVAISMIECPKCGRSVFESEKRERDSENSASITSVVSAHRLISSEEKRDTGFGATLGYHITAELYPGKTDAQVARILAWKRGYKIIARYKINASDKEYNHFALCRDALAFQGYQSNPNCHELEILYDVTKEAPKGLYCRLCKRYLPPEDCTDVRYMVDEDAVSFYCPGCRTSRVYSDSRDKGL